VPCDGLAGKQRLDGCVGLWSAAMTSGLARAQTLDVSPGAIGLGNRGWSASDTSHVPSENEFEFSARTGVASDYIYRGTTLSDHGPAAGGAVEARFGTLYAGSTVATVNLPTDPAAELTAIGGLRPKIANIDFDLGVTYFAYPGAQNNNVHLSFREVGNAHFLNRSRDELPRGTYGTKNSF
jgi:hypothetical protein